MLNKQSMLEEIRLGLSVLQHYIRPGGPMNLTDINVHAEDFVGRLLNSLRGWNLNNTNRDVSNAPCIDLLDEKVKVGVQVSSETGAGKINEALACLEKHGMSAKLTHFYHFSLVPRQKTYHTRSAPPGILFDVKKDVLDFDTLLKEIQAATDGTIAAVHKAVRESMPALFVSEVKRLEALRDELHRCQTIFDREVMRAPFEREDPVEMYKGIREMRISVQKRGASQIPHQLVADNFKKARTVLSECEGEVRRRYRYIHDSALTGTAPQYQGSDYGDAINLMMSIRKDLMPLLDQNDRLPFRSRRDSGL